MRVLTAKLMATSIDLEKNCITFTDNDGSITVDLQSVVPSIEVGSMYEVNCMQDLDADSNLVRASELTGGSDTHFEYVYPCFTVTMKEEPNDNLLEGKVSIQILGPYPTSPESIDVSESIPRLTSMRLKNGKYQYSFTGFPSENDTEVICSKTPLQFKIGQLVAKSVIDQLVG